jgi:hypothetical protein
MQIKRIFLLLLVVISFELLNAQTVKEPSYAFKSHETLEIDSIVKRVNTTEVYLSIINMIPEGSFCVDRNTYILLPNGEKSVATKISGIPVCPENYIFSHLNERLKFSLHFPGVVPVSFDLIEDCNDACFSIMGICSDEKLNAEINESYKN